MRHLRLNLLGPFQARLDDVPLNGFESNKVRGLLAYLVMEAERAHSRETLAELLWPEQPTPFGTDNLRYALADLRKNLGDARATPPFLVVHRDSLQFNRFSDCEADVKQFEALCAAGLPAEEQAGMPGKNCLAALDAAVRLYRGCFLEGFNLRRSAPFESWLLCQRERLERRVLGALFALAEANEGQGHFQQALGYAWRHVELAPWDEEAQRQLMRLLAYDGQRSAALLQYQRCCSVLSSELGVEPEVETTELYRSIRDEVLYFPPPLTLGKTLSQAGGELEGKNAAARCVAREDELEQLQQRFLKALGGEGQVVFITGEAGSGKTTLAKEFLGRALQSHAGLTAAFSTCNAFAGNMDSFLPFIDLLHMLAGDLEARWASSPLERALALHLWTSLPVVVQALVEYGPDLIDRFVPGEALLRRARSLARRHGNHLEQWVRRGESEPARVARAVTQSDLFAQVAGVLKAISRSHPLLLVLDDLQWADRDSLNLLFYLGRRLEGCRILVVGIYRMEEVRPGFGEAEQPLAHVLRELQGNCGYLEVDLSNSDGRRFIDAYLDCEANALGSAFRSTLERHTGGVPLFTVELVRGMQERAELVRDAQGRWVESRQLDWERLPPRLEAVIAEQTARLPPEWRRLLCAASVEGDDFCAETVARLLSSPVEAVTQQLSELLAAGSFGKGRHFVVAQGVQRAGPSGRRVSRYRFRHHLYQAYFYSRLDLVERVRLHEAAAEALEQLYQDEPDEIAVTLARHYESANLSEKAAACLLQAGKRAIRLAAYDEARRHFRRALSPLVFQLDTLERDQLELRLQMALAVPLIARQGYTSLELEQAYRRALQLVDRCGDDQDLFQVLSILKSFYNLRGDAQNSLQVAERLVQIAERSRESRLQVIAYSKMVTNAWYYARWNEMRRYVDLTLQTYDPQQHRTIAYQVAGDPKGMALAVGALGLWMMGYPAQARQRLRESLEWAEELDNSLWSWYALYYAALFHFFAGDIQAALASIQAALRVSQSGEMDSCRIYSESLAGWGMASAGDQQGAAVLENSIEKVRGQGDRMNEQLLLHLLADGCLTLGETARGLAAVGEALDLTQETRIVYAEAELLRLKGRLLLAQTQDMRLAAECFRFAARRADIHQTKMWELLALMDLAQATQETGEAQAALQRLRTACDWFSEGFDEAALVEARQMLKLQREDAKDASVSDNLRRVPCS